MKLQYFVPIYLNLQKQYTYILIVALVIFLTNVGLYFNSLSDENVVIKSYLNYQLDCIKNILLQDIQSVIDQKEAEHLKLIKNFQIFNEGQEFYENGVVAKIYKNDDSGILIDFSNVFEFLDQFIDNNFYYCFELNNKTLNCSNKELVYSISTQGSILNNNFTIKLGERNNSILRLNSSKKIKKEIYYRAIISLIIFIILVYGILSFCKKLSILSSTEDNIKIIKRFYDQEKEYIINCYQYTKKDQDLINRLDNVGLVSDTIGKDYLPFFLSQNIDYCIYKLPLEKISLFLLDIVKGYNIINNSNIILELSDTTSNKNIESVFSNEVLLQIIQSILRNFLNLKRNANERGVIKLQYLDDGLSFRCSLLKLNKEHLIKWSRNIFDITGNPFILDFYQIFKILEIFHCNTVVYHENDSLIIDIKFNLTNKKLEIPLNEGNVINISSKYKKK